MRRSQSWRIEHIPFTLLIRVPPSGRQEFRRNSMERDAVRRSRNIPTPWNATLSGGVAAPSRASPDRDAFVHVLVPAPPLLSAPAPSPHCPSAGLYLPGVAAVQEFLEVSLSLGGHRSFDLLIDEIFEGGALDGAEHPERNREVRLQEVAQRESQP